MKCLVNPHSSFWETMLRACILSTPLYLSFWVLYYTVTELCTIFLIFNAFLLIKLRDLDGLELFEIDSFLPHQWQKLVSFCDQNISYGSRLQKSQTLCENMNIHCISNFVQMVVMKSGWHMAWNLPERPVTIISSFLTMEQSLQYLCYALWFDVEESNPGLPVAKLLCVYHCFQTCDFFPNTYHTNAISKSTKNYIR